jgi:hypothetical protein
VGGLCGTYLGQRWLGGVVWGVAYINVIHSNPMYVM